MLRKYSGLLVALAFIGSLTWVFSWLLDKQHNPNQGSLTRITADGSGEVVLQRNRAGHYVANGRINGSQVQFFLDTGATSVSIPEPIAGQLGLQRGPAMIARTANGTVTVYATRLDSIGLGDIEMSNVNATINPAMHGPDILLGMSFLGRLDLYQQGDTLRLQVPAQ